MLRQVPSLCWDYPIDFYEITDWSCSVARSRGGWLSRLTYAIHPRLLDRSDCDQQHVDEGIPHMHATQCGWGESNLYTIAADCIEVRYMLCFALEPHVCCLDASLLFYSLEIWPLRPTTISKTLRDFTSYIANNRFKNLSDTWHVDLVNQM